MVGTRIGAPDAEGINGDVGGVIDINDGVVGCEALAIRRDDDNITEGGLRKVLELDKVRRESGGIVADECDVSERE